MIKVLIVDDHLLIREGIKSCLQLSGDIEVIGEAQNGKEALELTQKLKPDLILMDIHMPEMDGIAATKKIRQAHPSIKIISLTMAIEKEHINHMMRAGAHGYILKTAPPDEIITGIKRVISGERYLAQEVANSLLDGLNLSEANNSPKDISPNVLTEREKTVLQLICDGLSSKEMGVELNISSRTVESHIQNLRNKLSIQTTAGLIKYALRQGLDRL